MISSGVAARIPEIPGIDHPKVITYPDLLSGARQAGASVAIIGAGGIGFDVAAFLTHGAGGNYFEEWGIDRTLVTRGGLLPQRPVPSPRRVYLLQRKTGKPGAGLGKTTGWIHRTALKHRGVVMRRWRDVPAHRRCRAAHFNRGGTGGARRRQRHRLRGAGVGQCARRLSWRVLGLADARDRRRIARRRARCGARDS